MTLVLLLVSTPNTRNYPETTFIQQGSPENIFDMAARPGQDSSNTNNGVHDEEKGLHKTVTGVTMSPELFEKVSFLTVFGAS